MVKQSLDTSYNAELKQIELIRNSSIAKRIFLPRQKNLWVTLGKGKSPSL